MRLLKMRLKQFRRFWADQALDLNEDLIALVGPNEAGKSSILNALEMLGTRTIPDAGRDVTRNSGGPAEIEGLLVLEGTDKELIANIRGGDKVTHVRVGLKSGAQQHTMSSEPRPQRDREPRARCGALVHRLENDPNLAAQFSQSEHLRWDPQLFVDVMGILDSDRDSLTTDDISSLRALADRLSDLRTTELPAVPDETSDDERDENKRLQVESEARQTARGSTATALRDLAELESQPSPAQQVINALHPRLPTVAVFRQVDRELESSYDFDATVNETPPALLNLCKIAGLDLSEVRAARDAGKTGQVEKLFEHGNARLKERYLEAWNQSNVYPRFGPPHQGVLSVWIATEGEASYSEPHERSDGLRWFIALHAFLMALGSEMPILLVDEAETHLHYDAQADLIDTLMRQRRTAKIVYSTHSIGCLPPDLGRGIRAVLAEKDAERSSIENSYWSVEPKGDRVGYTPILFSMGASLLALTVPRYAVITEGPSDAVLLPTLLREAAELDVLPYRIVPGLADLKDPENSSLSVHAGAVFCLTDGDAAGLKRLDQIRESARIAESCLFHLGQLRGDEATLEDLVSADVFLAAIQVELQTWAIEDLHLDDPVPDVGRWNWLKKQGSDADGNPVAERLSKVRVAQRIVDQRQPEKVSDPPKSLVEPSVREALLTLHQKIVEALDIGHA